MSTVESVRTYKPNKFLCWFNESVYDRNPFFFFVEREYYTEPGRDFCSFWRQNFIGAFSILFTIMFLAPFCYGMLTGVFSIVDWAFFNNISYIETVRNADLAASFIHTIDAGIEDNIYLSLYAAPAIVLMAFGILSITFLIPGLIAGGIVFAILYLIVEVSNDAWCAWRNTHTNHSGTHQDQHTTTSTVAAFFTRYHKKICVKVERD